MKNIFKKSSYLETRLSNLKIKNLSKLKNILFDDFTLNRTDPTHATELIMNKFTSRLHTCYSQKSYPCIVFKIKATNTTPTNYWPR